MDRINVHPFQLSRTIMPDARIVYQYRIELPRHPALIGELVQLEQKPLPSGRIRIAAPPGGHDDYATALMALAHHLTTIPTITGDFSVVA